MGVTMPKKINASTSDIIFVLFGLFGITGFIESWLNIPYIIQEDLKGTAWETVIHNDLIMSFMLNNPWVLLIGSFTMVGICIVYFGYFRSRLNYGES